MKSNWETKRLNEISTFISRGISPNYTDTDDITVINQRCIRDHKIDVTFSRKHNANLKKVSDEKMLKVGDVLVNSTGVGTLGRVAQVKSEYKRSTVDSHVTIVRPDSSRFYLPFFGWMMVNIENQLAASGLGASGQIELSKSNLQNWYPLAYPTDISEQKEIVSVLERVFEEAERAKENAEKNLINAAELYKSYLDITFNSYQDGWETHNLGDITDLSYGYTDTAKDTGKYRFIRITDIGEDGKLIQENKRYINANDIDMKYRANVGDLLMARTGGTYAKVLYFDSSEDSVFASFLIKIKFHESINSKLYWHFSKSNNYWKQAKALVNGSAQPQFNGNVLKKLNFRYPVSNKTQKILVEKFDELEQYVHKLKRVYGEKLAFTEELKKSVLDRAFNGEL